MGKSNLVSFGEGGMEEYAVRPSPLLRNPRKEAIMVIGDRLRELREGKKLSQGDIEKRTGLLRCYISRVENGHTVPAIETLEKLARALEIPLYQLFYDGDEPPKLPNLLKRKTSDDIAFGSSGKQATYLHKLRKCLSKAAEPDRQLIMVMAQKMATGRNRRASAEA
jgi:transcriptional regulator with XRE-family HTH domain